MTVSTELSHEEYVGNGVTTDFDFRFRIFESRHLIVVVADDDGNETTLKNGTDYFIVGVGSYFGGKVVLSKPLAKDWKILLERDLPVVQETDLRNQGKFFAEVHEDAFDYLTMLIQKALGTFSLSLRKPTYLSNYYDAKGNRIANLAPPKLGTDAANKDYVDNSIKDIDSKTLRVKDKPINALPNTEQRANKILAFDDNGQPITVLPESGSASDVLLELGKPDGVDWIGGAVKQKELSSKDGACLVGINEYETLCDRLKQTFNATEYGLSDGGTTEQCTRALQRLSSAVKKKGGGLIIIPPGRYTVGIQYRNTSAEYDPGNTRAYGVENILDLRGLNKDVVIFSVGAEFVLADGLRFGAFDPETGNPRPYSPTSNDLSTRADTGFIFNIVESPLCNIRIIGGKFDGNMSNLILGGQWGDVGRQCDGYGIRARNYKSLYIEGVTIDKMPLDGLYTGDGWYASEFKEPKTTIIQGVRIFGCGRDNWSITGNGHYYAVGCDISHAAMFEVSSNPASGINIETEAGRVYQVVLENCVLSNCRDANFLTTSRNINGVYINNSLIYHNEEYFDKGTVAGVWMRGSPVNLNNTTLRNSRILNQIGGRGSSESSSNTPLVKNCYITNINIDGSVPTKYTALLNSDRNHVHVDDCVVEVVNPITGRYYLQLDGVSINKLKVFIKGRVLEDQSYSGILGFIRNSKLINSSIFAFIKDGSKRFGIDLSGTYDLSNTLFITNRVNIPTPSIFKHGEVFIPINSNVELPSNITVYQGQKINFLDGVIKAVTVSGCNSDFSHTGSCSNGRFDGLVNNPFRVGDIITVNGSVVGFITESGTNWVETTTNISMTSAVIRYQKPLLS
ncbi:hypothetical protein I5E97_14285 [Proteus hauseri]|nr:hypothetical protein [Proteus hauseri]MBG6032201.1 hypothetical protein [Proteus hauseri]